MFDLKILQVVRSMNVGGLENYVKNLLIFTNQKETCDCLICDEAVTDYENELNSIGIQIYHLPAPDKLKVNFYKTLLAFFQKHTDYDIVHCHMAGSNGLIVTASRRAGIRRVVCHSHGVSLEEKENTLQKLYLCWMRNKMKKADGFLACSEAAGEYLYGKMLFKERGIVVPNGIALNAYAFSEEKRKNQRSRSGIELSDFVLGHVGSLSRVKNQSLILEIAANLKKDITSLKVLLVGDGDSRQNLVSKANELGIEDSVVFTGKQERVMDYLSAMDVFIFPSLSEGFGLSLLEAEANGLPCVVSDKIQPEVKILDNVYTVPLAEGIQEWVDTVKKVKKIGRSKDAIEILKESGLDEEACYARVLRLYQEIK